MNTHDRNNLKFLLSLTDEAFVEFAQSVSQDDIDYALELLIAYRNELIVASLDAPVENVEIAKNYLTKFLLGGRG